jgi:acyl-ACP thioesterase
MNSKRKFREKRKILLCDVRRNRTLRIDAIFNYAQDIGRSDSYDLGVGEGGVWFARHTIIEIEKLPELNDEIELVTYCGGVSKVSALRIVEITKNGHCLIKVKTEWVHLDHLSFRPSLIPKWIYTYGENLKSIVRKYIKIQDEDFLPLKEWQIREADFDMNNHVNNARLAEVIETNPRAFEIKNLECQFQRPCEKNISYAWNAKYTSLKILSDSEVIFSAKVEYE